MSVAEESTRSPLALLGLLQLVSPALPIGAFAWSQGLESAFELGWVKDEATLGAWLDGVLEDGLTRCELPLLERLWQAWERGDRAALADWNDWLLANRETHELAEEDLRLGQSLARLLGDLGLLPEDGWLPPTPTYVTLFAWAAQRRGIALADAQLGFAWAWLENQLAAACKALPLGQTAAQRLVERLRPALAAAVTRAAALGDEDLGPALPGLALASALHETQYSRLFRS
ncbi:urease accessory UreF family protein [Salinicola sp. JS01]|uniref:urease accessory protein UreF n=1 Tax=Salinicola sp. JS01 TaxID=3050071 RepID=UPI00255BD964|nr:urease accessory UreF family protein [Salinicola sp. JS01]WIX34992.1 urease accessory UreF family protein [Salinicola sp. JS01]